MERERFGSKFTFVMALAGSAIGLGNIWRFPYVVGEYGGAAFVVVYVICSLLISLPILYCETIIGRNARCSIVPAMDKIAPGTGWKRIGILALLASFIIGSFYSVVGGWSVFYFFKSLFEGISPASTTEATAMFGEFSGSVFRPIFSHGLFLATTTVIVLLGITRGIERFTKITTPLLFVMIVLLAVFSLTLPGSQAGVDYLVQPDFSKLNARGIAYAMGQSFFSMSLGIGCVLIYSTYMKKETSVSASGLWTCFFDTLFAIIAGFAVMPAVFSAGIAPGSGPTLVFETLPYIFSSMSAESPILSRLVSTLFFFAILMAALTSSISVVSVCVEHLCDRLGYGRKKAANLVFLAMFLLGSLCSLSFGVLSDVNIFGHNIFGACDTLASNYLMMAGAFAFSIFVGWVMDPATVRAEFTGEESQRLGRVLYKPFRFLVRWVVPIAIFIVFVSNFLL